MNLRRMGEDYIDQDRRDAILEGIKEARAIAADLDERTAELSAEMKSASGPMGTDANKYRLTVQTRIQMEPQVAVVEQRLSSPGPMWTDLTAAEQKVLTDYVATVDAQAALLNKYFPTRVSKDAQKIALLAIGIGAIFSPLLWETGESWSMHVPGWPGRPSQAMVPQRSQERFDYESRRPSWTPQMPAAAPAGAPTRMGPTSFRSPSHGTYSVMRSRP